MRLSVKTAAAVVIAAIAGVASAQWLMGLRAMESGAGSWQSRDGAIADNDPYLLAHYLMAGRLPPVRDQMSEFEAANDSEGRPLTAGCSYSLALNTSDARWWSLSASRGGVFASPSAIAAPDGAVAVAVAPFPMPGNWLQSPPAGNFRLILRMLRPADANRVPPGITRRSCP